MVSQHKGYLIPEGATIFGNLCMPLGIYRAGE